MKAMKKTDNIDDFLAEYKKVLSGGSCKEVVEAVGASFEDKSMELMAGEDAQSMPDEVLGKVAREVYKWTDGERDVADLFGASKIARCRMCKHALFGVLCASEARRSADLTRGRVPEFCEKVGRDQLFGGSPCEFFAAGFGDEVEDD